jgi:hypothetical protein
MGRSHRQLSRTDAGTNPGERRPLKADLERLQALTRATRIEKWFPKSRSIRLKAGELCHFGIDITLRNAG